MLRANVSFFAGNRLVSAGDLVDPKDPVVKGREALFDAPTSTGVEQATAAPGEKRATRPRATRTKGKS